MPSIIIENRSSETIYSFVSKYSNSKGSDEWYKIQANGGADSWNRNNWELVAFKNEADSKRAGIYIPIDKKVIFHSFDDIRVD
ncbi:hypothetical protein BT96DRAFT_927624 [Gymnopus androsaceus JB14]|uniref:Uncharacterized protein n=1 Tax=Gymnopus androsaceus JB14 TaxID=1447944 RepID=A0A6A4GQ89_9AGAR|nr:hypothetical protein BT96DRAFT_927624 [Gymnopus androsaceus JB14]